MTFSIDLALVAHIRLTLYIDSEKLHNIVNRIIGKYSEW